MQGGGTKLEVAAASHIGRRRQTNADAVWIAEDLRLFSVADGMGDAPSSAEAARGVLDDVHHAFIEGGRPHPALSLPPSWWERDMIWRLGHGVARANHRLYARAQQLGTKLGSTIAAVAIYGRTLCIAYVGDSRVLLLESSGLRRLTRDHTVFERAVRDGMDPRQARTLPTRHGLTRALGRREAVECRPFLEPWSPGNVVLLCTDGLTDVVTESGIERILVECATLPDAAERLVQRANEASGHDNSTVVLVRGVPAEERPCSLHGPVDPRRRRVE